VNGASRSDSTRGGGGAGGAIYVEGENVVSSATTALEARGGAGGPSYSGGGGGGRIAVIATSTVTGPLPTAPWDAFDASGGLGTTQAEGGAGTFYRRVGAAVWGDLIVDNEGIDSEVDATALPMPGPITSTALTPTVLTDAFATFPALEGLTFTSAAGNGTPN